MAAPSLSTASPEPRNPEETLNRRSLLTGAAACAVAGPSIAAAGALLAAGPDPALLAYEPVRELDRVLWYTVRDEDDPHFVALLEAYDRAEAAFADTRATTPAGIRAKLNHVAYLYAPDAEGEMCRSSLATSIVADFAHVLARTP